MFGKNKETNFYAPITGKLVDITEVPDEVFSQKMMGDGIAIIPTQGKVFAPVEAEISLIFDTLHAIGLKTKNGIEILIHVGLNTVNLNGQHFKSNIKKGEQIKPGQLLLEFDLPAIITAGYNPITPIIIMESEKYGTITKNTTTNITQNTDTIFTIKN